MRLMIGLWFFGMMFSVTGETIDFSPEDGFKKVSYGLVVTEGPKNVKRAKDGKTWLPDPDLGVETWEVDRKWKAESDLVIYGSEVTPNLDEAEGDLQVHFGATFGWTASSKHWTGWKKEKRREAKVLPRHATWKIDPDTGLMNIPPRPGRDNGMQGVRVRVSDGGKVECDRGVLQPNKEARISSFEWKFLVRETTRVFNKEEKLVKRRVRDYTVEEWHFGITTSSMSIDKNGKKVWSQTTYARRKEPTPLREYVLTYDAAGKVVMREDEAK